LPELVCWRNGPSLEIALEEKGAVRLETMFNVYEADEVPGN
jgi:hypothetical protein